MADTLQQWINDASAYELLNTYRIEQQELYPFVNNGEDFYISLLNRMFFTMRNKEMKPEDKNGILLQIVKGLQVYSEETTADIFNGVNRNNNLLYILQYTICASITRCRNCLCGELRNMNLKMNLHNYYTALWPVLRNMPRKEVNSVSC